MLATSSARNWRTRAHAFSHGRHRQLEILQTRTVTTVGFESHFSAMQSGGERSGAMSAMCQKRTLDR